MALSRARYPHALPDGVNAVARVVVVGQQAWALDHLREAGRIETQDLAIDWVSGQNSIHDTREIPQGRDVGNVIVRRRTADGLTDMPYDVSFAFAFSNFVPDGILHR